MKINSRAKGQRGEREVASVLSAAGFDASRGATQSAGAATADVVGLPGHWVEVKSHAGIAAVRHLDQAKRDVAASGGGAAPVVVLRENRGPWAALVDLRVYLELLRLAIEHVGAGNLELANFVEKSSRPVKVEPAKRVNAKLASVKSKNLR